MRKRWLRRAVMGGLLAAVVPTASVNAAQSYPSRPIRLVVPFTAGGGTDIAGRIVAARLAERLDASIVIENKRPLVSAETNISCNARNVMS